MFTFLQRLMGKEAEAAIRERDQEYESLKRHNEELENLLIRLNEVVVSADQRSRIAQDSKRMISGETKAVVDVEFTRDEIPTNPEFGIRRPKPSNA